MTESEGTGSMEQDPVRRVGDYLIEDTIGRGGMGIVYRARREDTGEVVALKLMAPELADNPEYRARFVREATFAPTLDHPNIVPIYESGETDGQLFIAMKLIEGRDLKELLRQEGPLEPSRAIRLFRQAADALDAAHEAGVVHRDVKPQNILVSPGRSGGEPEIVYLTDFGLVRPVASETASRTGQVFGSVPYMAPEAIEALPADGRADVYGLGCVLFECLTGAVPFERENEVAAMWAHIHEDPPLVTDKKPDIPGGVNDVLIKTLSKHPDDRFLTCGEMVAAFEIGLGQKLSHLKYAYMRPLIARVPRKKTEREVWSPNYFPELSRVRSASRVINWWKIGAFATASFMIASVQVGREGGLPRAVADITEAAGSAGQALIEAVDRDEDEPADRQSRGRGDPEPEAPLRDVAGPGDIRLPGTLVGSRQGAGGGGAGPTLQSIAPPGSVLNKSLLLFTSDRRYSSSESIEGARDLFAMNADGSGLRNLSEFDPRKGDTEASLSSCRQLMFVHQRFSATGKPESATLYAVSSEGRTLLETNLGVYSYGSEWSPDCNSIVYQDGGSLVVRDVYGSGQRTLWTGGTVPGYPDWSPDGSKILFDVAPTAGARDRANIELYVIDADGTDLTRLTSSSTTWETHGNWSPDGKLIAYQRGTSAYGDSDVWVMNADGSQQRRLTDAPGDDIPMAWSPDGRNIMFFTTRAGRATSAPITSGDIYIMDSDGSNERDLVPNAGGSENWSADWQPAVYRTISARIEGGAMSGRLNAMHARCAARQTVYIEKREGERWFATDSVVTGKTGTFRSTLPSSGDYRARVYLSRGKGGFLCGLSTSTSRTAI